jgi:hypothetical protein
MSNSIKFSLFTFFFFFTFISHAQWLADVRLTNAVGQSLATNDRSIAVTGDIIHVVWLDERPGWFDVYYKASGNGGVTWSPDANLTNITSGKGSPSIWVSGPVVHVAWPDSRDGGNTEMYYKRSTNGGFSWSGDIRMTNASGVDFEPSITATGQIVHLCWTGVINGNSEIFYKASADGGVNWSPNGRLTNNSAVSYEPSVWVSGPDVHLAWTDTRDGNNEIYYKRSTNGGFSWGSDIRLTFNPGTSFRPSITATGDIVHLVWIDNRDGNYEIYYKASADRGLNWSPDGRLTNNPFFSGDPSLYVFGPFVHVSWYDERNGNSEIYHKLSTNGGFSWGSDLRLTNNAAASVFPSIAVQDSKVHVVWRDNRDGNYEIYYKRNPTGNPVGIEPINSEIPGEFSLEQNYPNPFNPVTTIKFSIPHASFVKLLVYDITGREAAELINQQMNAGIYTVDFDASELSSGVYFYRFITDRFTGVKKMNLIK